MSNPFSTRCVRPGALPFIFPTRMDAESLVARLAQQRWLGAIVGPHGSGKSTLLESLIPAIRHAGRTVQRLALRDGERRLPTSFCWPESSSPPGVFVVDGYEQLGWLSRWRLNSIARQRNWGLLVTIHSQPERYGLPTLYQMQPSLNVFLQIVERLLASRPEVISRGDITAAFQAHPENLREALFSLYDLVERRRALAGAALENGS